MNEGRRKNRGAFVGSVLIGAFAGLAIQLVATSGPEPRDPSELWAVPVIILGYGCIALPFVAIGLALFGLPAAWALRRHARQWWIGVVAVIWGAVAGKLFYYAIDHLLFFGNYEITDIGPYDLGPIYGIPTGLAWWLLHRREVIST